MLDLYEADTNLSLSFHSQNGLLDKDSKKGMVPDSAIRAYKSKFVEPALAEGFAEIVKVRISLTFKNKKLEELYMKFLD